jgi:membrane protease YdiL (CAAX protease family)
VPAYILLAVIVVLLTVVAVVARAVVAKARPEDLPHILPGLGQVLASLALFLPWGLGTRGPAVAPTVRSERRGGRRQPRG